jgi:glycolate oxidase iron-sulfur subunit
VGCITHLQSGSNKPVRHWIEIVDDALSGKASVN